MTNSTDILLIYPPDRIRNGTLENDGISYSISHLKSFLKQNGIENVYCLEFSSYKKINQFYYNFIRIIAQIDIKYCLLVRNKISTLKKKFHKENNFISNKSKFKDYEKTNLHELFTNFEKINEIPEIHKKVKTCLKKINPRIVGVSIQYYSQLKYALYISNIIKEYNKKIFIVFGGPLITKNKNIIIKNDLGFEIIDSYIIGDGEIPLLEMIKNVDNYDTYKNIPNLLYKSEKKFIKSSLEYSAGLETLSIIPEYNTNCLIENHHYFPLRASIGCYWGKCTFCSYNVINKKFIILPPKKLIDMIKKIIKKYGIRNFFIISDALPPLYLKRFSQKLINDGIKIKWRCGGCVDKGFFNYQIPLLMKKAGCEIVRFGIESMSPRILKLMRKMHKIEDVYKILESFNNAGLKFGVNVMFGFPSETWKDAEKTLQFLINNKNLIDHNIKYQPFVLEEDTQIYNNLKKYNISKIDKSNKESFVRVGHRFNVKRGMSQRDVMRFFRHADKVIKSEIVS